MVTPDIAPIDRRIILEAQTLQEAGKEVILIASNDGQHPEYEVFDGIKLYRPKFDGVEERFGFILLLNSVLMMYIAWISKMLNQGANATSSWTGHCFNVLSSLTSKVLHGITGSYSHLTQRLAAGILFLIRILAWTAHYLILFTARWGNQVISLILRMANLNSQFVLRCLQIFSGESAYDHFLANRISFFRPDVVHAHDLPVLKGAVLAARRCKAYCIYDSHELYTEEDFANHVRWWLSYKERSCLKHVDWVLTVNHFIADELQKRYGFQKIKVVENCSKRPPGFDPEKQHYDLFRKEYQLPSYARILLYQGWFAANRNLATLVEGMACLDHQYYLVMMGYGSYVRELERLAQNCRVSDRVIFVPAKSQAELLYYTASADVGVMPYSKQANLNNFYSSPNKLYEFIAAGLPILANRLPYYEEIIGRFRNGLVADIDTPEAFACAVQEIFTQDLEELRRHSLAAYRELNWDREATKILMIYKDLENRS